MKRFCIMVLFSSLLIGGVSCVKNATLLDSDTQVTTRENGPGAEYNYTPPDDGQESPPPVAANDYDYSSGNKKVPPKVPPKVDENGRARLVVASTYPLSAVVLEVGYEGYPAFAKIPADRDGTKTLWLTWEGGRYLINVHLKSNGESAVQSGRAVYPVYINGVKLVSVEGGMYAFKINPDGTVIACDPCDDQ